jgi:glycosyltransferase involved in cell wall biosynthesis
VEQANRGQAAARSCGIAEARGEFIALLDDDDLWPPDKLEWQVSAHASAPDSVVVYGPAECIDGRGALVGPGVSGRRQFCWMGPDLVSWRTADAGVFRY